MVTTGVDHSILERGLLILENEHARTEDKVSACTELEGYFNHLIEKKTDITTLSFSTCGEKLVKVLIQCLEKDNNKFQIPVLLALKPALQLLPKRLGAGMQVASQCYGLLLKSVQTSEENVNPSTRVRILVELFRCISRFDDSQFVDAVVNSAEGYTNNKTLVEKCLNFNESSIECSGVNDKQENSSWILYLKLETLQFTTRLIKICGSLLYIKLKEELDTWFDVLLPSVFMYETPNSSVSQTEVISDIRKTAREAVDSLLKLLPTDHQLNLEKWPKIKKDIKDNYAEKMQKSVGVYSDWATTWCLMLNIIGSELHRKGNNQLINKLLSVEEKAFKFDQSEVRCNAFSCWKHLIDKFLPTDSKDSSETTQRSVRLLVQPLQPFSGKTDAMSLVKLGTWWHLIQKLEPSIENYLKSVLVPFLIYCYGSSKLKEQPPGKKFSTMHLPCAKALASILDLTAGQNSQSQMSEMQIENSLLPPFTTPLLKKSSVFINISEDLIFSIGECISLLSNHNDTNLVKELLRKIWNSFLNHVQVALANEEMLSERKTKLVQDILRMLNNMIEHSNSNNNLEGLCISILLDGLVTGPHAFSPSVLSSPAYYVGSTQLMTGTPTLYLMELMLSQSLLKHSTTHERYVPILKAVMKVGITHHNVLVFIQSVLKQMEVVATASNTNCSEKASLCIVWTTVTAFLLKHLKNNNFVNQGNDKQHDFSCMYLVLLYPFNHFYSIGYKQFMEMLTVWCDLFKCFHQIATNTVSTLDINEVCETMASKINQALFKCSPTNADQALTLFKAIQNIIMLIPFKDICESHQSPKNKSKYILPDRGRTSKQINYIGNTVTLLVRVSNLFYTFECCGEWYNTSGSIIMNCLELVLKKIKSANASISLPAVINLSDALLCFLQVNPVKNDTCKFWQDSLQRMWKCFLNFIDTCLPKKAVKEMLGWMSVLLEAGFKHEDELIRNTTVTFWDNTVIPSTVKDKSNSFMALLQVRKICAVTNTNTVDISSAMSDNASDQLENSSNKVEPKSEFAIPQDSHKKKSKSLVQQLQEQGKILTKHQKEMFRRKKEDIPALYSSSLQPVQEDSTMSETSQDTSEFVAPQRILDQPDDNEVNVKKEVISHSPTLKVLEPPSSLRRMAEYRKKMMIDSEESTSNNLKSHETSKECNSKTQSKHTDSKQLPVSNSGSSSPAAPLNRKHASPLRTKETLAVTVKLEDSASQEAVGKKLNSSNLILGSEGNSSASPCKILETSTSLTASENVTHNKNLKPSNDKSPSSKNESEISVIKLKSEALQEFDSDSKSNKISLVSTENTLTNYFKPVSVILSNEDCGSLSSPTNVKNEARNSYGNINTPLKNSSNSEMKSTIPIKSLSPVKVLVEKLEDFSSSKTLAALELMNSSFTIDCEISPSISGHKRRKSKSPLKRSTGDPKLPPFKQSQSTSQKQKKPTVTKLSSRLRRRSVAEKLDKSSENAKDTNVETDDIMILEADNSATSVSTNSPSPSLLPISFVRESRSKRSSIKDVKNVSIKSAVHEQPSENYKNKKNERSKKITENKHSSKENISEDTLKNYEIIDLEKENSLKNNESLSAIENVTSVSENSLVDAVDGNKKTGAKSEDSKGNSTSSEKYNKTTCSLTVNVTKYKENEESSKKANTSVSENQEKNCSKLMTHLEDKKVNSSNSDVCIQNISNSPCYKEDSVPKLSLTPVEEKFRNSAKVDGNLKNECVKIAVDEEISMEGGKIKRKRSKNVKQNEFEEGMPLDKRRKSMRKMDPLNEVNNISFNNISSGNVKIQTVITDQTSNNSNIKDENNPETEIKRINDSFAKDDSFSLTDQEKIPKRKSSINKINNLIKNSVMGSRLRRRHSTVDRLKEPEKSIGNNSLDISSNLQKCLVENVERNIGDDCQDFLNKTDENAEEVDMLPQKAITRRAINKFNIKSSENDKIQKVASTTEKETCIILQENVQLTESEDIIESSQESNTEKSIITIKANALQNCKVTVTRMDVALQPGRKVDISQGDQKFSVIAPRDSLSPFKVYSSPNSTESSDLQKNQTEMDQVKLHAVTRILYTEVTDVSKESVDNTFENKQPLDRDNHVSSIETGRLNSKQTVSNVETKVGKDKTLNKSSTQAGSSNMHEFRKLRIRKTKSMDNISNPSCDNLFVSNNENNSTKSTDISLKSTCKQNSGDHRSQISKDDNYSLKVKSPIKSIESFKIDCVQENSFLKGNASIKQEASLSNISYDSVEVERNNKAKPIRPSIDETCTVIAESETLNSDSNYTPVNSCQSEHITNIDINTAPPFENPNEKVEQISQKIENSVIDVRNDLKLRSKTVILKTEHCNTYTKNNVKPKSRQKSESDITSNVNDSKSETKHIQENIDSIKEKYLELPVNQHIPQTEVNKGTSQTNLVKMKSDQNSKTESKSVHINKNLEPSIISEINSSSPSNVDSPNLRSRKLEAEKRVITRLNSSKSTSEQTSSGSKDIKSSHKSSKNNEVDLKLTSIMKEGSQKLKQNSSKTADNSIHENEEKTKTKQTKEQCGDNNSESDVNSESIEDIHLEIIDEPSKLESKEISAKNIDSSSKSKDKQSMTKSEDCFNNKSSTLKLRSSRVSSSYCITLFSKDGDKSSNNSSEHAKTNTGDECDKNYLSDVLSKPEVDNISPSKLKCTSPTRTTVIKGSTKDEPVDQVTTKSTLKTSISKSNLEHNTHLGSIFKAQPQKSKCKDVNDDNNQITSNMVCLVEKLVLPIKPNCNFKSDNETIQIEDDDDVFNENNIQQNLNCDDTLKIITKSKLNEKVLSKVKETKHFMEINNLKQIRKRTLEMEDESEISIEVKYPDGTGKIDTDTAVFKIKRISQNSNESKDESSEITPQKLKSSKSNSDSDKTPSPSPKRNLLNSPSYMNREFSSPMGRDSNSSYKNLCRRLTGGRGQHMVGLAMSENDISVISPENKQGRSIISPRIEAIKSMISPSSRKKLEYNTPYSSSNSTPEKLQEMECGSPSTPDHLISLVPHKRSLKDTSDKQDTPPSKKRRVWFPDPVVSNTMVFSVDETVLRGGKSKSKLNPLLVRNKELLRIKRNELKEQISERLRIVNTSCDGNAQSESSNNLLASIHLRGTSDNDAPIDGKIEFRGDSLDLSSITSQGSITEPLTELLNSQDPFFPSLINCNHPVENVAPQLSTHVMWTKALVSELHRKNISTIGDLSKLDEASVNRLPIVQPKISKARTVLQNYLKSLENENDKQGAYSRGGSSIIQESETAESRINAAELDKLITSDKVVKRLHEMLNENIVFREQLIQSYFDSSLATNKCQNDNFEKLFSGDLSDTVIHEIQSFLMSKRRDIAEGTFFRCTNKTLQKLPEESVLEWAASRHSAADAASLFLHHIESDTFEESDESYYEMMFRAIGQKLTRKELTKLCCSVLMEKVGSDE